MPRVIRFTDFWDGYNDFLLYKHIIEHYAGMLHEDTSCRSPDYLLYSVHGCDYTKHDCIRIYYTGENDIPDFNRCDYAIGFARLSFEDRYLRFPLYAMSPSFEQAKRKHLVFDGVRRPKFCNMVVSNRLGSDPARLELFHRLSEYKHVDSGGIVENNVGGPVPDKLAFQQEYRFSIACENSRASGYITEKIVDAWAAGTIPIYWGDPEVVKEFNPRAFINCHDYTNYDDLIKRINDIENDDELYHSIMREPIITPGCLAELYDEAYLDRFLDSIFLQDIAKASRRCFYGRAGNATEQQERLHRISQGFLFSTIWSFKGTIRQSKHNRKKEILARIKRRTFPRA